MASDWAELEVQLWEDDSSGGAGTLRAHTRVPLKDSFWHKQASGELNLQMEHATGTQVTQPNSQNSFYSIYKKPACAAQLAEKWLLLGTSNSHGCQPVVLL